MTTYQLRALPSVQYPQQHTGYYEKSLTLSEPQAFLKLRGRLITSVLRLIRVTQFLVASNCQLEVERENGVEIRSLTEHVGELSKQHEGLT